MTDLLQGIIEIKFADIDEATGGDLPSGADSAVVTAERESRIAERRMVSRINDMEDRVRDVDKRIDFVDKLEKKVMRKLKYMGKKMFRAGMGVMAGHMMDTLTGESGSGFGDVAKDTSVSALTGLAFSGPVGAVVSGVFTLVNSLKRSIAQMNKDLQTLKNYRAQQQADLENAKFEIWRHLEERDKAIEQAMAKLSLNVRQDRDELLYTSLEFVK